MPLRDVTASQILLMILYVLTLQDRDPGQVLGSERTRFESCHVRKSVPIERHRPRRVPDHQLKLSELAGKNA